MGRCLEPDKGKKRRFPSVCLFSSVNSRSLCRQRNTWQAISLFQRTPSLLSATSHTLLQTNLSLFLLMLRGGVESDHGNGACSTIATFLVVELFFNSSFAPSFFCLFVYLLEQFLVFSSSYFLLFYFSLKKFERNYSSIVGLIFLLFEFSIRS